MALLEAIQIAKRAGLTKVHLEGDCVNVINALTGSLGSIRWKNNTIIRDCNELLKVFNNWVIRYVPRGTNCVADLLAKDAISMASSSCWSNEAPMWLDSLIKEKLCVQEI